jgi:UDP-N-acetylglucosamine--N-acetylmuramyl-(pentapeptide) pyrophosphoryl-undecaprenol N-acetylglucosamine transferase
MTLSIVLAGGGTGGHIEPALNLADEFRRRDPQTAITALGTSKGLETAMVPKRGYSLELIPPVPLPRKPSRELLSLPSRIRTAVRAVQSILEAQQAAVVVGFGGYVSIPAYIAAWRSKVPIVVHEANARAGLANRVGARLTKHVAENYAGSLPRATRIGCPLRSAITDLDREVARPNALEYFGLDPDKQTLLAFGGSQGAQRINAAVSGALADLADGGIQVLHAVGPANETATINPPQGYHPVPFIDRMDLAYAAADIVVSRSGAMTCAEVAAVGLPALYVPYPIGNGEQKLNAEPVVAAGGGIIVDDADLNSQTLLAAVIPLLTDRARLDEMGVRAAAYGIPDAASRLADMATNAAVDR